VRLVGAENEREQENRHNRYLIPPEVILRTEREARAEGSDIIGYYHSHPDHPSKPSAFDREHAWPGYSYLIVSVRGDGSAGGGRARDERSWRLSNDRKRFDEEPIECLGRPAPGGNLPGLPEPVPVVPATAAGGARRRSARARVRWP